PPSPISSHPSPPSLHDALPIFTFHLGRALGREWREGDVVVVTELDHHANSDTWRALAKERGVEIRTVRMRREDGRLDEEDLAGKDRKSTRLNSSHVAISYAVFC